VLDTVGSVIFWPVKIVTAETLMYHCEAEWRCGIVCDWLTVKYFWMQILKTYTRHTYTYTHWFSRRPLRWTSVKISRNKRKRQPIGMLGRSSGNHDWLLANARACVSCGFRLHNALNASDCIWMELGFSLCVCVAVCLCAAHILWGLCVDVVQSWAYMPDVPC